MTRRLYSNTATEATLSGGVAAADLSFALTGFAGYPGVPFTATISRGDADEEVVLVTAVSGSTVTATRGYDGTTAKSHSAGATFVHTTVAKDFDEANAHGVATTGVHGVAGAVVGTTDTQSLSNKTLVAPTLAGATFTGTTALGNGTVSGTLAVTGATSLSTLTASTLTVSGVSTLTGGLSSSSGTFSGTVSALSLTAGSATISGALAVTGTATAATPTTGTHLTPKAYVDTADAVTLAAAKAYADTAVGGGLAPSLSSALYGEGSVLIASGANTTPTPGSFPQAVPSTYFTRSGPTFTCVKAGVYSLQFATFSDTNTGGSVETRVDVTNGINAGIRDVRYRGTGVTSSGKVGTNLNWVGYIGAGGTFTPFIGHINSGGVSVSFDFSIAATLLVASNP